MIPQLLLHLKMVLYLFTTSCTEILQPLSSLIRHLVHLLQTTTLCQVYYEFLDNKNWAGQEKKNCQVLANFLIRLSWDKTVPCLITFVIFKLNLSTFYNGVIFLSVLSMVDGIIWWKAKIAPYKHDIAAYGTTFHK